MRSASPGYGTVVKRGSLPGTVACQIGTALAAATVSTAEESLPPEKLTRHGGRSSALAEPVLGSSQPSS